VPPVSSPAEVALAGASAAADRALMVA